MRGFNMSFPLLLLPRRVMHVDDDQEHLAMYQMLAGSIERTNPSDVPAAEFVHTPGYALNALKLERPYWRALEETLSRLVRSRQDHPMDAAAALQHHFRDWRRFRVSTVVVMDYKMPGMSGLQILAELGPSPASKVMLTGQADRNIGIDALNRPLIHKFVEKSVPDLVSVVQTSYDDMHVAACERLSPLVRPLLAQPQQEVLQDEQVATALWKIVHELKWVEHLVIGQPFGLIGTTEEGPLQFLQLETPASARELADVVADRGYPADVAQQVATGSLIAMDDVLGQLGVKLPDTMVASSVLTERPLVRWALQSLPVEFVSRAEYGLDSIFTVDGLMQAQLRNVRMALNSMSRFGAGREVYAQTVSDFAAIATAGRQRFKSEAEAALSRFALPRETKVEIEAALAAGKAR